MSRCAYYFRRSQCVNEITSYCYKCQAALNNRRGARFVVVRGHAMLRDVVWRNDNAVPETSQTTRNFHVTQFPGQILLRRFTNSTVSRQATPPCLLPKTSDQSHKHTIRHVSLHTHFLNPPPVSLKPKHAVYLAACFTEIMLQINFCCTPLLFGDRGSTVVKVLCYKSEGCWFDRGWCQWIFYWHKILPISLWPWGWLSL